MAEDWKDKAPEIAAAALEEARRFFSVGMEWEIKLERRESLFPSQVVGHCDYHPDYLIATISYVPERMTDGARLWNCIGHEVAHVATCEFGVFQNAYRVKHGRMSGPMESVYTHLTERIVTRLDRLWSRERPFPGMERF